MLALYDHFLGPNNVDQLQKQSDVKPQNLPYAGERKNWNFEQFVTENKE